MCARCLWTRSIPRCAVFTGARYGTAKTCAISCCGALLKFSYGVVGVGVDGGDSHGLVGHDRWLS